ncbi:hypothetical protein D3C80_824630 [compost metagenome]
MLCDVTGNLTATGGVTDVNDVLQIERLDNGKGVGGVMIHVVTVGHLGGAAMATPVMGDHAKTL